MKGGFFALLSPELATRLIRHTTGCVDREYPNTLKSVEPRSSHPAFFGCFDWHSSVHGHWAMARLIAMFPDSDLAVDLRRILGCHLTQERIAGEITTFAEKEKHFYECPYGWAWFLHLCAELRDLKAEIAGSWLQALSPLERTIVTRSREYFAGLYRPIRYGLHGNSAFSLALMIDYAQSTCDETLEGCLRDTAVRFFGEDTACPTSYEPSPNDFLSPCLAEAEVMRRVLEPQEFKEWFDAFIPVARAKTLTEAWGPPPPVGHLIGLMFHRAWCLDALSSRLEEDDPRRTTFRAIAESNCVAGLEATERCGYEGTHWVATFAIYLLTGVARRASRGSSQD